MYSAMVRNKYVENKSKGDIAKYWKDICFKKFDYRMILLFVAGVVLLILFHSYVLKFCLLPV